MSQKRDLLAVAQSLAPFLPGYAAPTTVSEDWRVALAGPDGRAIHLRRNRWGEDRIYISGIYPRFEGQEVTGYVLPLRIPSEAGQGFRREGGHPSDVKAATDSDVKSATDSELKAATF